MRIGLIAPPWLTVPPRAYGGTEAVIAELAVALSAAGHDVILAAASDSTVPVPLLPGTAPADPERIGVDLPELRHVALAYGAFDELGVDVVHDHTIIGPLYRYRGRAPVVTTAHGIFDDEAIDVYRRISVDTAIVAISHRQAELARPVPIHAVVHHGIDPTTIPVGNGGDYACFVGRMDPTKGIVDAIRIANRAQLPLRIAAKVRSSGERAYFTDVVSPLLGPNIDYMGEIDHASKFALLGGARVFLNPIRWEEPFGMVIIEALFAGTPVVTNRIGSAPELIRDGVTGYLCDGVDECVDAVRAVSNIDRAACRTDAETRFSAKRMADEYLQIFTDVIGGTP